jgi:hypothetical protein
MNEQETMFLLMKGHIAEQKPEVQAKIMAAHDELVATIKKHGSFGFVAVALIGVEVASDRLEP